VAKDTINACKSSVIILRRRDLKTHSPTMAVRLPVVWPFRAVSREQARASALRLPEVLLPVA